MPSYLPDIPAVREDLRQYYDEIGRLDSYVGQVVAELDRQHATDNTLIVFISDNGRPFPRDKTTLYEGGIKTPWIVKWPNQIKPGSTSKSLVSTVDLAPTFLELAGLNDGDALDGVSLAPIFADADAIVRKYVFAEDHWHDYEDHARSVSDQQYKLIRNDYTDLPATPSADAGRSPTWQAMLKLRAESKLSSAQQACFVTPRPRFELYDLVNDPDETRNLAQDGRYRTVFDRLRKELEDWTERTGDWMPSRRTPDLCVIWGANVATDDYHQMSFDSGSWTCYVRWPSGVTFHANALSNNHLITDQQAIRDAIEGVRVGDQVHIKGKLVNYTTPKWKGFWRKSSLTREDVGNTACEVFFVDSFAVMKRGTPIWYALIQVGLWGAIMALLAKLVLVGLSVRATMKSS